MQAIAKDIYIEDQYLGATLGAINFPHGLLQVDAPPSPEDARTWRAALLNLGGSTERLLVNLDSRAVTVDASPLHLTAKEYGVLELLSLRKGRTLTKEMFFNHLYGSCDGPEPKNIDVFVCKLRKRLAEATGGEHYIENVWGQGYVMRDPETLTQLRSA